MNAAEQPIEYKGARIELWDEGTYILDEGVFWGRRIAVSCGMRLIFVYAAENAIEAAKSLLDKTSFDDWFKQAASQKSWSVLCPNIAHYLFPA